MFPKPRFSVTKGTLHQALTAVQDHWSTLIAPSPAGANSFAVRFHVKNNVLTRDRSFKPLLPSGYRLYQMSDSRQSFVPQLLPPDMASSLPVNMLLLRILVSKVGSEQREYLAQVLPGVVTA